VGHEPNWASKLDRIWAWLKIEVDLTKEIELVFKSQIRIQKIDYWRLPFRCYVFHELGHLQSSCNKEPPFKMSPRKIVVGVSRFVGSIERSGWRGACSK
jgi:hypothetical protein